MEKKRVRHACARCRRQKLRCDNTRPCQLCLRSGFECQDATERTRRSNRVRSKRRTTPSQPPEAATPVSLSAEHDSDVHDAGIALLGFATPSARVRPSSHVTGVSSNTIAHHTNSQYRPSFSQQSEELPKQQERSSTFSLVEKLFKSYSTRPGRSDAIPGGTPIEVRQETRLIPVETLIGIPLPPTNVIKALLDTYMSSCHWYITLFHEPSFRNELQLIFQTHEAHESQKPFLMFLLTVLLSGARFCREHTIRRVRPSYDYSAAQVSWMNAVEMNFLSCVDKMTLYDLGSMFLLATLYLNRQKTSLAFSIIGMLVRGAQAIELHKEASWGRIDPIDRHVRRLVWWSIYKAEGYSAQAYGKPSSLNETDFQVSMPIDIDETAVTCPGFGTLEKREDGSMKPVTILSYNRHKANLYLIAAPITRNMYFKSHQLLDDIIKQVEEVHRRLLEWEKQIPLELRVTSFTHLTSEIQHNPIVRVFALQALTLQAAYDNIQILLFRPFIGYQKSPLSASSSAGSSQIQLPRRQNTASHYESNIVSTSRTQCWISAMRLSTASKLPNLLHILEQTSPFAQWISYSFNGGVMLTVLALSNPLSKRAQECKRAIARLIRTLQNAQIMTEQCVQVVQILTDLVHLIAKEEIRAMLADGQGIYEEEAVQVSEFGTTEGNASVSFDGPYPGEEANPNLVPSSTADPEHQLPIPTQANLTINSGLNMTDSIPPNIFPEFANAGSPSQAEPEDASELHASGIVQPDITPQIEWWRDPNLEIIGQTWMWNDEFSFI